MPGQKILAFRSIQSNKQRQANRGQGEWAKHHLLFWRICIPETNSVKRNSYKLL
jgi:hypothetical protein